MALTSQDLQAIRQIIREETEKTQPNQDQLFTEKQAATYLGISERSLRHLRSKGRVTCAIQKPKYVRYTLRDLKGAVSQIASS